MSDKLPPMILVVEPNKVLNTNMCNAMERSWFNVTRGLSADAALRVAETNNPNVAIISSKVQDQPASELATSLRKTPQLHNLPIVFLLESGESRKNYGFIDDNHVEFLFRPFTPNDLVGIAKTLLRKSKPVFQDKIIKHNDITMDLATYRVRRNNVQIHLGPTEFKILQLFVQQPKNIYSRSQIIDYVWGADEDIAHRTIDVHINRIRTLMKLDTDKHHIIKTIRSAGYCLD
ncbi:winged helix-turn-helix domain-containing protein [Rickettsiaceae bacterium]|nr:winged helix-turn-helix domain-containing protein [Rickettsiaceae bacterium]